MSIVGTRPPLISETNLYELHHRARLAIKPGITGMWQVKGRSTITDFEEVVRLDKEYIENWNFLSMFQQIFNQAWTISAVKEYDQDSSEFYSTIYKAYNMCMVITCAGLILFDKVIAKILFGTDFYEAWKYAPFLMISVVFGALVQLLGGIFSAAKESKAFGNTILIGAAANTVMNAFLSNQTSAPGKVDFLRYTWHLYHLHLNENLNVNNKNNRSNKQLLCIINDDCTYFVDMISHPEKAENYFKLLYLKIIQRNNWMEHIGYLEIPGMVPGSQAFKVTSEEDIFELYSKGPINIFLEIENKGYISWDSITSTRNPQRSAEQMRIINRNIRKLNNRADDYKGFTFETDKAGLLMGMVEFENSKQEALRIDILKDIGRHPGE